MEILKIIFSVILEMSIVSSIVGTITLVLRKILKHKISPKWLNLVWSVFLVTLINPIRIQSDFSIYNFLDNKIIFNNNGIIVNEALDKHTNISEFNENIILNDKNYIFNQEINENIFYKNKNLKIIVELLECIIDIVTITYFIALVVNILFSLQVNIKFKKSTYYIFENERLKNILEKIKRKIDIEKDLKVIEQDLFATPAIYGVISPKILLNKKILELNDDEIELILCHELLHMKNGDIILNKMLQILKIVYCFNPIIIFLLNRVKKDIELANDEKVLEKIEKEKVNLYCKTLLKISLNSNKEVCRALGMASRYGDLEERIIMIKENNKFLKNKIIIISTILIVVLGITVCFATDKLEKRYANEKNYSNSISESFAEKYILNSQSVIGILDEIKKESNINFTGLRNTVIPIERKIVITSTYGKRMHPIKGEYIYHNGIDILAKTGDKIMSIANGKIESTGFNAENGNYIEIKHLDEETEEIYYSFYAHLSKIDVEAGDIVEAGEKIGEAGSTGYSTGAHLHIETRDSQKNAIDPAKFIKFD